MLLMISIGIIINSDNDNAINNNITSNAKPAARPRRPGFKSCNVM